MENNIQMIEAATKKLAENIKDTDSLVFVSEENNEQVKANGKFYKFMPNDLIVDETIVHDEVEYIYESEKENPEFALYYVENLVENIPRYIGAGLYGLSMWGTEDKSSVSQNELTMYLTLSNTLYKKILSKKDKQLFAEIGAHKFDIYLSDEFLYDLSSSSKFNTIILCDNKELTLDAENYGPNDGSDFVKLTNFYLCMPSYFDGKNYVCHISIDPKYIDNPTVENNDTVKRHPNIKIGYKLNEEPIIETKTVINKKYLTINNDIKENTICTGKCSFACYDFSEELKDYLRTAGYYGLVGCGPKASPDESDDLYYTDKDIYDDIKDNDNLYFDILGKRYNLYSSTQYNLGYEGEYAIIMSDNKEFIEKVNLPDAMFGGIVDVTSEIEKYKSNTNLVIGISKTGAGCFLTMYIKEHVLAGNIITNVPNTPDYQDVLKYTNSISSSFGYYSNTSNNTISTKLNFLANFITRKS